MDFTRVSVIRPLFATEYECQLASVILEESFLPTTNM